MNEISPTEFSLIEPFDIDDGSLDGVSAAECFSLGVEWQIFRSRLASGKPFTDLVLANQGWVSITVGDQLV